ncbi:MAG: SBBP repeat-containing protein [Candidatus Sulfotelmatobacter sp.]
MAGNKSLAVLAAGLMLFVALSIRTHSTTHNPPVAASAAKPAIPALPAQTPSVDDATKSRMLDALARVPMSFEINRGQTDRRVQFLSRGAGYTLFLTRDAAVLALPLSSSKPQSQQKPSSSASYPLPYVGSQSVGVQHPGASRSEAVLNMRIVNANPQAHISGVGKQLAQSNYFIGNDPSQWRTNVSNYEKVRYAGVYPGVDLVYYGNQKQLEYDFVVSPGADPSAIALAFGGGPDGGKKIPLTINRDGDLVATLQGGAVTFHKPIVYQQNDDSAKTAIDGRYLLNADGHVGFELGTYDHSKQLIIDPVLSYCTYLGGSNDDISYGITYGVRYGQPILVGSTRSADFPQVKALYPFGGGTCGTEPCRDIFVAKYNPALTELIFSTFIGGDNDDVPSQVTQDVYGDIFLVGYSLSTNFPVRGPVFQKTFHGGSITGDAVVVEVESAGFYLEWSSYLGGSGDDQAFGVAVDTPGNVYVSGHTTSTDFPVTAGAYQTTCPVDSSGGCSTSFVTKVNPKGTALVYSTYLGGSNGLGESAYGIALDANDNVYLSGITGSPNYPTTPGAYQTQCGTDGLCNGTFDGFVTQLNSTGNAVLASTFLGGSSYDYTAGIVVNPNAIYVSGSTVSSDFPVTANAAQPAYGGGSSGCIVTTGTCGDVTVTKLNTALTALQYSTYLGGSLDENPGLSMAVDTNGYMYVTGQTDSLNFPQVNPLQAAYGGGASDAFITQFTPTGAFGYSSYFGGNGEDFGYRVALDPSNNVYITGGTLSTNLPVTSHAVQKICGTDGNCNGGFFDAWFSKIILSANLSMTDKAPATVATGANLTYTLTAKNNGPDTALSVSVTDATPTGTTFVSVTPNAGTCTAPPVGGTGTVTCTVGAMANGTSLKITLVVNVNAASGSVITDTATVTSTTYDPNLKNNTATAKTTVD